VLLALLDPGAQVEQQLARRWLVRAGHVAEHAQQIAGGPAGGGPGGSPQLFGHARLAAPKDTRGARCGAAEKVSPGQGANIN
jgi:hypothetical protein